MEEVYDVLIGHLMNERMDRIVAKNERFRMADEKYKEALKKCDELPLSKADALVVDRTISAFAEQSAVYGELAYEQGIKDTVWLMKEMGVIGK